MDWRDKTLVGSFCAPKICHVIAVFVGSYVIYLMCCYSIINRSDLSLLEILVAWLFAGYLASLCLSSALLVFKGNQYINRVKQLGETFLMWNIHGEHFMFAQEDVREVTLVKYSFMDQALIGFSKYRPGYRLYLNDGKKFFITADMANLETLKAALLGEEIAEEVDEDHTIAIEG